MPPFTGILFQSNQTNKINKKQTSMNKIQNILTLLAIAAWLTACGNGDQASSDHDHPHPHEGDASTEENHGHEHDEVSLGTHDIAGVSVEVAQGHGSVEPGKEGHLVIKLSYNDNGASTVRAWIGTDDRTLSSVGKGEYAPSHDDYDIHAVAPAPLPDNAQWWVEIEKPDGAKSVGSIPLLKDISK
jgi:ABC-type Zn2+ transport system substrate-binding protein/surface adhesin